MNEWKTGAKLADDKPERWPHGWTHRSDAPTVIERWEKGRVEEGERVGKREEAVVFFSFGFLWFSSGFLRVFFWFSLGFLLFSSGFLIVLN